jgi:ribonuclease HII
VAKVVAWSAVVIPCHDIDRIGLHRCNIAGMRRAVTLLETRPAYVLSDGFPVPGLDLPTLAVTKGDRVAACIAAASVVAKVTRDRLMVELHDRFPAYGFDVHKGYVTREHSALLATHGPCPEHRFSFVNVARLSGTLSGTGMDVAAADVAMVDEAAVDETAANWALADRTPDVGRRAMEAGMQDNGSDAVGGTGGYGAALEGVAEQAGVA